MDPSLRQGTSILFGARPRAVSLAGRPLPANPHERYPLVHAKVSLADAVALHICARSARGGLKTLSRTKRPFAATFPSANRRWRKRLPQSIKLFHPANNPRPMLFKRPPADEQT